MLWKLLKPAGHVTKPTNMSELKRFYPDEWTKIPPNLSGRCCCCTRVRDDTDSKGSNTVAAHTFVILHK